MTDHTTETARDLLYRHGLPEDVLDGVLALHAQELAAVQRREAAVWGVDTAAGKHILSAADLIDPTRSEAAAAPAVVPSADRAVLRGRIAAAIYEHMHPGSHWSDTSMPADWRPAYLADADAVLAVLPAPAADHRLALSVALGLGTGAPWDAIHDRATELAGQPAGADRAAVLTEVSDEETDADVVANRAAQVITSMGAEIRALTGQRDRYRFAWTSARERAQAYGEGILRVVGDREAYQQWLKQAEAARDEARLHLGRVCAERDEARGRFTDAADEIVEHCPDHGDAESVSMACHCEVAEQLRRLVGEAAPDTEAEHGCAHCGKPVRRITGTLAAWWVHVPGGIAMCDPQQGEASPRATPSGQAVRGNTETHSCPNCEGIDPDSCLTNLDRPAVKAQQDAEPTSDEAPGRWCKCRSCWGWFVEEHPGEDLDELGKDLGWWSGLPEHRDAPSGVQAEEASRG